MFVRKIRSSCGCELITIPVEIKKHLDVKAKDYVTYEVLEDGRVVLSKGNGQEQKHYKLEK